MTSYEIFGHFCKVFPKFKFILENASIHKSIATNIFFLSTLDITVKGKTIIRPVLSHIQISFVFFY